MSRGYLIDRLYARLNTTDPSACWEWQGSRTNPAGYGQICVPVKRRLLTHRVSWVVHHGPIPADLWVLHRCDNRPCVNPAHLFLGTVSDNTLDMYRKGRGPAKARGARHGNARFTDAQVAEIRARHAAGGVLLRELADEFGVDRHTISRVVRGVSYV